MGLVETNVSLLPARQKYCDTFTFLSTSLYFSKRVVMSLVVTRVHCGQTVHPRPIVTMEH